MVVFKNRYKEIEKRIERDKDFFIDCCDFAELEEIIKDWDSEIQDIAHSIEKDNFQHEIRKELKIDLRNYARKKIIEIWKKKEVEKNMKTIKGDLVLEEDMVFEESIRVEGNIRGKDGKRFNMTVKGNIYAENIDARNIDARNIYAGDIHARNIDAGNIDAGDIDAGNIDAVDIYAWGIHARNIDARNIDAGGIDAGDMHAWDINAGDIDAGDIDAENIICVSRNKKSKNAKTIAYSIVLNRYNREKKEVMPE